DRTVSWHTSNRVRQTSRRLPRAVLRVGIHTSRPCVEVLHQHHAADGDVLGGYPLPHQPRAPLVVRAAHVAAPHIRPEGHVLPHLQRQGVFDDSPCGHYRSTSRRTAFTNRACSPWNITLTIPVGPCRFFRTRISVTLPSGVSSS